MNNTNPPQRPLSSTSLTASNDRTPHRKQSTASLSTNHRRSNSNPNNLDTFEYVVGNNSSTSLSNNLNNNNNNNNSKRRSSLLPPLHESSSSGNNNNGNRNDPDYSSPSLPFSPYTPPTLLSQRFNHESDNEDENNASYDDDPDDSDRTEGSENTPSMAKANAAAGSSSARLRAPKRPTYDHKHDRCQQRVYLEEEDVELIFTGYRFRKHRIYLYYIFCALSFGIIFLLGRWMPRHYIAFVAQKCEMNHAEFIVVQNEWGQLAMESVFTKYYGGPIDSVFSPEQMEKSEDNDSYDETVV
ncbi:MAG: P5-type ATPase cation transporter-domain-containing protein [Linnemannia elongata]|nr:MAG: P5-type ATPase cation transporter-domain-containing protein [Linnemannia elongata]